MATPNTNTKIARLANFTEKAYKESFDPPNNYKLPFRGPSIKDPILRPKGVNRILLYPGSFNPPHRGHWTLLEHVFNNAGDDLNLTAVIVLPTDDRRLAAKTYKDPGTLIIPQSERARLWNEANVLTDCMWVFDRDENDWKTFRSNLESDLSKARLDVRFIMLTGPDYIKRSSTTDPTYFDCKDTITSDISRPVDFITQSGELSKVYPCSQWQRPKWDSERLAGQLRARMKGQSSQDINGEIQQVEYRMGRIWVCHRLLKPKGTIRFVWTGQSSTEKEAPSSTRIRSLLQQDRGKKQKKELYDIALSSDLLLQLVQNYSLSAELRKVQDQMREQEAKEAQMDWRDKIKW